MDEKKFVKVYDIILIPYKGEATRIVSVFDDFDHAVEKMCELGHLLVNPGDRLDITVTKKQLITFSLSPEMPAVEQPKKPNLRLVK
jgi:hypothetical protein